MNEEEEPQELYEEIERRALFDLPDEDDEPAPDLIGSLSGADAAEAQDMTLGGYLDKHSRVPAFEGADGQPYTVDVDVEEQPDEEQPFAAFLVFIRWAETGAGIMNHVESGDVARGDTEADARRAALELSLYEIKAELDAAIARRKAALED
jgi:hypothetical protein